MIEDKLRQLRGYYHSLLGQQRVFEDAAEKGQVYIEIHPVHVLAEELSRLEADFSGLIPPFPGREVFHQVEGEIYCNLAAIRAHLAMALGKLKVAIETPESTPVTQTREFSFVKHPELRRVLERDYSEIQRAYVARCWKSVIILSGGAIEAILADLLLRHPARAKAASKAPKKPDITEWDLADLINVCVELGPVSSGLERLSHSVRAYRNLVHPGNEIRNKLTFDEEEAKIALEVLHIVHRDLSA